MKLQQNQVWKVDKTLLRITVLERLSVTYKFIGGEEVPTHKHLKMTKKAFCRFIKDATLVGTKLPEAAETLQPPPAA
jgi:hypothetical protein